MFHFCYELKAQPARSQHSTARTGRSGKQRMRCESMASGRRGASCPLAAAAGDARSRCAFAETHALTKGVSGGADDGIRTRDPHLGNGAGSIS
jgi:hypothetical protein